MSACAGDIVLVHNIPSPYRVHLFERLHSACTARGVRFRVEFMAMGHVDRRYWGSSTSGFGFRHRFWNDLGPSIRGKRWHWNPDLVRELCGERPEILIVGGAWDSLTGIALSWLRPCRKFVSWLEGNIRDAGRISGPVGAIKRSLLRGAAVCAVPGQSGADYVACLTAGGREPQVLLLPNVVDERRFLAQKLGDRDALRRRLGLPGGRRLAIWPARMIPAKGIIEFLSAVEESDFNDGCVVIVGDGPLRGAIEQKITERRLGDAVYVFGSVPYDAMPEIYRAADLFLLPSVHDPNPLSVVEALHSGLPIVLSSLAGNACEAVPTPENGWSVNPFDVEDVRASVRAAFSANELVLNRMGGRSQQIAASYWSSDAVAARFVDGLLAEGGRQ